MSSDAVHQSVLLAETVAALLPHRPGVYVDATFGRGGHTRALLAAMPADARVLVFDKDPEAIAEARALAATDARVTVVHESFATLEQVLAEHGLLGQVVGIMADLGVSSPQLDVAERGFSFQHDGPLDMRMDTSRGETAAQWLQRQTETSLADALFTWGEERHARRIARAIVAAGARQPLTRTAELASVVSAAHPAWERHKHPATRAFQAIRIVINRELDDLDQFLPQTLSALAPGGRLAIISFHSLEDRRVKQFLAQACRGDDFPPGLPITQDQLTPDFKRIGKPQVAAEAELALNPRARSARLRVAERLAVPLRRSA